MLSVCIIVSTLCFACVILFFVISGLRSAIAGKPVSYKDMYFLLPPLFFVATIWYFCSDNLPIRLWSVQFATCWIMQFRLLASSRAALFRKNHQLFSWIVLYNGMQVFQFLPLFFFMWISQGQNGLLLVTISTAVGGLLSSVLLYFYPRALYNIRTLVIPLRKTKPTLDRVFIQRLTMQLELIMREQKPFLNPDYTMQTLADTTGVPLYKLSAYLNQATGTNFSEYLNKWRIRYCLDLIHEKKAVNLNLRGIATKCGFNNRNTFSTAFKKITGQSPSDYLQIN